MITLPPIRHASLRSFWLAITFLGGIVLSAVLALLAPRWVVSGIILALVLAVAGLLLPLTMYIPYRMMYIPYRIWNELVCRLASYARVVLLGICFYLIFVAVGRTGSSLRLERPPSPHSLWVSRGTIPTSEYGSQARLSTGESSEKGWMASFPSWAAQSGNLWACGLVPFLLLLSALETDQETRAPVGIYTLF